NKNEDTHKYLRPYVSSIELEVFWRGERSGSRQPKSRAQRGTSLHQALDVASYISSNEYSPFLRFAGHRAFRRLQTGGRPGVHNHLGHVRDQLFGLIFRDPGLVLVVISEGGNHDGTGFAIDQRYVIAHIVEVADLVGDGRTLVRRVNRLQIMWNHVAVLLVAHDLDHLTAQ